MPADRVLLRPFHHDALPALVALWNEAVAARRNARVVTETEFSQRILASELFDPRGLILAWKQGETGESLVGFVHAFKPPPQEGMYRRWGEMHHLGPLYVSPAARNQGTGGRLLQAAESWLYYCPVHVMSEAMPLYGTVEGPQPPFFGTSERMGVSPEDRDLIHFLSRRGYRVTDPGSVSMTRDLAAPGPDLPHAPDLAALGLRLARFSHEAPLAALEPSDRPHYSLLGENRGRPYAGLALLEGEGEGNPGQVAGHVSWYPLRPDRAALANFRVAPQLRGRGLGRLLLDSALHDMMTLPPPLGGFRSVELYTHLVHNERAVALYAARGFEVDAIWVNLVKT